MDEDKQVGCLLWMDDVVLTTHDGDEMQEMQTITYNASQPYYIEFGQTKSQAQSIGKIESILLTIGRTLLNYTEKYKYLRHTQI